MNEPGRRHGGGGRRRGHGAGGGAWAPATNRTRAPAPAPPPDAPPPELPPAPPASGSGCGGAPWGAASRRFGGCWATPRGGGCVDQRRPTRRVFVRGVPAVGARPLRVTAPREANGVRQRGLRGSASGCRLLESAMTGNWRRFPVKEPLRQSCRVRCREARGCAEPRAWSRPPRS